jgi:hypothetical protein
MPATCFPATLGEIVNALAMAVLERPWATSESTSRFPRRERGQDNGAAAGAEQVTDDFGAEDGAAVGHPGDRVDEVADVSDAVFQQVSDASGCQSSLAGFMGSPCGRSLWEWEALANARVIRGKRAPGNAHIG